MKVGESGVIVGFDDTDISLKLLEMGCLPGTKVLLSGKAPLGDPICVDVCGYMLCMRMEEAYNILLEDQIRREES